jgi:non-homologous end joining protein Ku
VAARAYWKGSLKLSLVSCPVLLYPATTSSEKTRFHMINKETGNRLRQQMVDAEPKERPDNVISLMDALKQSLKTRTPAKRSGASHSRRTTPRRAAKRPHRSTSRRRKAS